MGKGTLYWITGLSGAGKTTIGNALYYELKKKQDNLIILDGDILKKLVGNSLGYSQSDRKKRAYYYSNLCKTLTDQGISVVICTIAMYDEVRDWNRANIEKYVEVFLNVNKRYIDETGSQRIIFWTIGRKNRECCRNGSGCGIPKKSGHYY